MIQKVLVHNDLRNRYYCEWLKFLKGTEHWTQKQISDYQLCEIRRIVSNAYNNTVGYNKLYNDYGIFPSNINSLEEFRKLPLITKEMIRDHLDDFSVNVKRKEYVTTGGSTGVPFGFYRSKIAFSRELASKAYQYRRIGWKEGDRQIVIRGSVIPSADHIQFYPRFNELRCSSYYLTDERMEEYRRRAWKFKPDWVKFYPSSGYIFAKFLKKTGRDFPPLKGVLCASENLYDYQKKILQEVFKARVFSHYGHYELAALAGFCEKEDTYHVLPQYGYVELLDKNGKIVDKPGQVGEIVATSFLMNITPFVRYKTKDIAVFKSWGCKSCGRPYQIWDRIEGRLQEFVVTKNNRFISMTAMNMHDNIFDSLKQFQFLQEKKGQIIFNYVADVLDKDEEDIIKKRLLIKLGDDVDLIMKKVSYIPTTTRGKHRFLVQKLNIEYGDI